MAIGLPLVQERFQWDFRSISLMTSLFYWVYAIGQLTNGVLGDRVSSRHFVLWGIVGTACMNLLLGRSSSIAQMSILLAFNGYFQSMAWGPIVRTASHWFSDEQRNWVSGLLGTSFVFGYLISWSFSARILVWLEGWEAIFWIPSIVLFIVAILWWLVIRDRPQDVGLALSEEEHIDEEQPSESLATVIRETRLFLHNPYFLILSVITIVQGMIKDGISLWVPALLSHVSGLGLVDIISYSLFTPLFGFFGVISANWLNKRDGQDEQESIVKLFCFGFFAAIGVLISFKAMNSIILSLMIGLCSAAIYGVNVLLLANIPMRYASVGRASTLAGFLDFASYVGSGLMSLLTGLVVTWFDWWHVVLLWLLLFAGGVILGLVSRHMTSKQA